MHLHWTVTDARLFNLYAVGLHGRSYPEGEAGIHRCFHDLGTLQLDPLPIMGRSHDLVVQARVDGTHPAEVYKPAEKRRWGYYVLPVLYGDKFVARFDGKYDRKNGTLRVTSYHREPGGLPHTHHAIEAAFERFVAYLGGEHIDFALSTASG